MTGAEFVRQVMVRLDAGSPAELAETMRWRRGTERTVAKWLAGQTRPSFDYVMEMVERAGLFSTSADAQLEQQAPADPLAALAVTVGQMAATQIAIADALGVPPADVALPRAQPSQQPKTSRGHRRRPA